VTRTQVRVIEADFVLGYSGCEPACSIDPSDTVNPPSPEALPQPCWWLLSLRKVAFGEASLSPSAPSNILQTGARLLRTVPLPPLHRLALAVEGRWLAKYRYEHEQSSSDAQHPGGGARDDSAAAVRLPGLRNGVEVKPPANRLRLALDNAIQRSKAVVAWQPRSNKRRGPPVLTLRDVGAQSEEQLLALSRRHHALLDGIKWDPSLGKLTGAVKHGTPSHHTQSALDPPGVLTLVDSLPGIPPSLAPEDTMPMIRRAETRLPSHNLERRSVPPHSLRSTRSEALLRSLGTGGGASTPLRSTAAASAHSVTRRERDAELFASANTASPSGDFGTVNVVKRLLQLLRGDRAFALYLYREVDSLQADSLAALTSVLPPPGMAAIERLAALASSGSGMRLIPLEEGRPAFTIAVDPHSISLAKRSLPPPPGQLETPDALSNRLKAQAVWEQREGTPFDKQWRCAMCGNTQEAGETARAGGRRTMTLAAAANVSASLIWRLPLDLQVSKLALQLFQTACKGGEVQGLLDPSLGVGGNAALSNQLVHVCNDCWTAKRQLAPLSLSRQADDDQFDPLAMVKVDADKSLVTQAEFGLSQVISALDLEAWFAPPNNPPPGDSQVPCGERATDLMRLSAAAQAGKSLVLSESPALVIRHRTLVACRTAEPPPPPPEHRASQRQSLDRSKKLYAIQLMRSRTPKAGTASPASKTQRVLASLEREAAGALNHTGVSPVRVRPSLLESAADEILGASPSRERRRSVTMSTAEGSHLVSIVDPVRVAVVAPSTAMENISSESDDADDDYSADEEEWGQVSPAKTKVPFSVDTTAPHPDEEGDDEKKDSPASRVVAPKALIRAQTRGDMAFRDALRRAGYQDNTIRSASSKSKKSLTVLPSADEESEEASSTPQSSAHSSSRPGRVRHFSVDDFIGTQDSTSPPPIAAPSEPEPSSEAAAPPVVVRSRRQSLLKKIVKAEQLEDEVNERVRVAPATVNPSEGEVDAEVSHTLLSAAHDNEIIPPVYPLFDMPALQESPHMGPPVAPMVPVHVCRLLVSMSMLHSVEPVVLSHGLTRHVSKALAGRYRRQLRLKRIAEFRLEMNQIEAKEQESSVLRRLRDLEHARGKRARQEALERLQQAQAPYFTASRTLKQLSDEFKSTAAAFASAERAILREQRVSFWVVLNAFGMSHSIPLRFDQSASVRDGRLHCSPKPRWDAACFHAVTLPLIVPAKSWNDDAKSLDVVSEVMQRSTLRIMLWREGPEIGIPPGETHPDVMITRRVIADANVSLTQLRSASVESFAESCPLLSTMFGEPTVQALPHVTGVMRVIVGFSRGHLPRLCPPQLGAKLQSVYRSLWLPVDAEAAAFALTDQPFPQDWTTGLPNAGDLAHPTTRSDDSHPSLVI
jgi:hypothetical protein